MFSDDDGTTDVHDNAIPWVFALRNTTTTAALERRARTSVFDEILSRYDATRSSHSLHTETNKVPTNVPRSPFRHVGHVRDGTRRSGRSPGRKRGDVASRSEHETGAPAAGQVISRTFDGRRYCRPDRNEGLQPGRGRAAGIRGRLLFTRPLTTDYAPAALAPVTAAVHHTRVCAKKNKPSTDRDIDDGGGGIGGERFGRVKISVFALSPPPPALLSPVRLLSRTGTAITSVIASGILFYFFPSDVIITFFFYFGKSFFFFFVSRTFFFCFR